MADGGPHSNGEIEMVKTMIIGGKSIDSIVTRDAYSKEFVVRVRETGTRKWDSKCDYWAVDKHDALQTQERMMHDYRTNLA